MVLGLLAGCEKDKDKNAKSTPKIVKGSVKEMAEAMAKVKAGTLRIDMDAYGMMTMTIDVKFDTNAQKYSLGFGYTMKNYWSDEETKVESGEIIRIVGGNAYINLDSSIIAQAIAQEVFGDRELADDQKLGWFKIPLPDDLPKQSYDTVDIVSALMTRMDSALKGTAVHEEADGNCSYTFETGEDYKNLTIAVREFVDQDLKGLVKKMLDQQTSLEDIDMNAYANKVIDFYKDDVRSVIREYGDKLEVTEAQFDALLKEAEKQDFQALWKQYVEKELSSPVANEDELDQAIDKLIKEIDDELQSKDYSSNKDTKTTVRVEADNEGYTVGLRVVTKSKSDDQDEEFKLSLRLIPDSASVSAPSGTKDLKELADLVFPAYTEYVDKSKMYTDVATLSDLMAATEKIAVDPQFDLPAGAELIISIDDNDVEFTIEKAQGSASYVSDAISEWGWMTDFDSFRTDTMKKAQAEFVGTLQMDGSVVWELRSADSTFSQLIKGDYFVDFCRKYNIEP